MTHMVVKTGIAGISRWSSSNKRPAAATQNSPRHKPGSWGWLCMRSDMPGELAAWGSYGKEMQETGTAFLPTQWTGKQAAKSREVFQSGLGGVGWHWVWGRGEGGGQRVGLQTEENKFLPWLCHHLKSSIHSLTFVRLFLPSVKISSWWYFPNKIAVKVKSYDA